MRRRFRCLFWMVPGWVIACGNGAGHPAQDAMDPADIDVLVRSDGTSEVDPPDPDIPEATPTDTPASASCQALFGLPNEKTGLTLDQCRPLCDCEGKRFAPPVYTEEQIAAIAAMVLLEPLSLPAEDPYLHPELHVPPPGKVCAVQVKPPNPGVYHLGTFDGWEQAQKAGFQVTHEGACGLCSPLVNLAVYMRHPDLTDPVRECGLRGMFEGEESQMQCLRDLGFDEPCARIWFYNTRHTQARCQDVCLAALDQPYHHPDGTLNDCLLCDERESGDVFKAVAGRTRRNTGLPSSMCRPCSEVQPILHEYRQGL